MGSEQEARAQIDRLLVAAGWHVQDPKAANLHAGLGVAIREFPLKDGHGYADYMLYVDGKAAGVLEAKKEGVTLSGVETQSNRYVKGSAGRAARMAQAVTVRLSVHRCRDAIHEWLGSRASLARRVRFPQA